MHIIYSARSKMTKIINLFGGPGTGKSEFLDFIMIELAKNHKWRFGICSMENPPDLHFIKLSEKYLNTNLLDIFNQETGEIYYISEFGDSDELPDDVEDPDKYIEIPHKNELDLGESLVLQFVSEHISEEMGRVEKIFRKKGAYSRFKTLLEQKGLLDQWHDYENRRTSQVLREWCKDNKIDII